MPCWTFTCSISTRERAPEQTKKIKQLGLFDRGYFLQASPSNDLQPQLIPELQLNAASMAQTSLPLWLRCTLAQAAPSKLLRHMCWEQGPPLSLPTRSGTKPMYTATAVKASIICNTGSPQLSWHQINIGLSLGLVPVERRARKHDLIKPRKPRGDEKGPTLRTLVILGG